MIRLFIENNEVELNEDFSCPITKTFEDIENPTNIKNDFSKTITIPYTRVNNKIFGYLYNPDRQIISRDGFVGLDFDPYKKLNFRLEYNDIVLMIGYLKVLQTTSNGYECTLNGELGKIFQELQRLTFDKNLYTGEEKDKYWIDGTNYEIFNLNKNYIKDSWTNPDSHIINFIRNDAFSDNFNYNVSQSGQSAGFSQVKLEDILTERKFLEKTKVEPSNIINNGVKPRDFLEYRSYNQIPTIRIKDLFNILNKQLKNLDDWSVVYEGVDIAISDRKWFTDKNPYWKDYSMLLRLNKKSVFTEHPQVIIEDVISTQVKNQTVNWTFDEEEDVLKDNVDINVRFKTNQTEVYSITLSPGTYFQFDIKSGENVIKSVIFCKNGEKNLYTADEVYEVGTELPGSFITIDGQNYLNFGVETVINNNINPSDSINIDYNYTQSGDYLFAIEWRKKDEIIYVSPTTYINTIFNQNSLYVYQKQNITLNDLWDNTYSFYNQILKYCKIFNIKWVINEFQKIITLIPSTEYFKKYQILDWTDKIDKSKDFIVKPITFETKYLLFNTADNKIGLNENYKTLNLLNIGEKRIETFYNFNNETNNLFTEIKFPIVNTPTVLYWADLLNTNIEYYLPAEIITCNYDKDNKEVDTFGTFGFLKQGIFDIKKLDDFVKITDDYLVQVSSNKPNYNGKLNFITPLFYLYLDDKSDMFINKNSPSKIENNYYLSLFEKPAINYTYENERYDDKTVTDVITISTFNRGIYNTFWETYINERYNKNTKLVTCYLDITPIDYFQFSFNKFIKINNQIYQVNKIYDYDITTTNSTKVDLITVRNISGYTTNNFTI